MCVTEIQLKIVCSGNEFFKLRLGLVFLGWFSFLRARAPSPELACPTKHRINCVCPYQREHVVYFGCTSNTLHKTNSLKIQNWTASLLSKGKMYVLSGKYELLTKNYMVFGKFPQGYILIGPPRGTLWGSCLMRFEKIEQFNSKTA